MAVGLTLVSLGVADFLITRLLLQRYVDQEFGVIVPLPLDLVLRAIAESVRADPAILAFWAIALISAFELPSRVKVVAPALSREAATP